MPPKAKPKYCKVCGETNIDNLVKSGTYPVKNGKVEAYRNLCKKCRQEARSKKGYTDWSNGKVCVNCLIRKPISSFSVPSCKCCIDCGGREKSRRRYYDKLNTYRKTEKGRQERRLEDKTEASKLRHKRYNQSTKRKEAISSGLTGAAKAICHPNKLSVFNGLCSKCHRRLEVKQLSANYVKQLLTRNIRFNRSLIPSEMIVAKRMHINLQRLLKEKQSHENA